MCAGFRGWAFRSCSSYLIDPHRRYGPHAATDNSQSLTLVGHVGLNVVLPTKFAWVSLIWFVAPAASSKSAVMFVHVVVFKDRAATAPMAAPPVGTVTVALTLVQPVAVLAFAAAAAVGVAVNIR